MDAPSSIAERSRICFLHGFSLTELLVVAAIAIALMAFLIPAFRTVGQARKLDAAGTLMANLCDAARENSMSKNGMTALVVLTPADTTLKNRVVGILELQSPTNGTTTSSSNWKVISKWESLPEGVVIDPVPDTTTGYTFSFLDATATTPIAGVPTPTLPGQIRYGVTPVSAYKYIVFLPGGSLLSGSSAQARLVEGYFPTGSDLPTRTHLNAVGQPANYFNITVLAVTGRSKLDRP
jgi:type II secretory pathway pseudopilin PulG